MKIGIVTFHRSLNCGAALQAWALQTYLQRQGLDARIVNYGSIGWPSKYYFAARTLRNFVGMCCRNALTFLRSFAIENYRRHLYLEFLHDKIKIGNSVSKADLGMLDYSHLICGSDQIWHPQINEGDDAYFLAFGGAAVKRIAYAPSFGVNKFLPEHETRMSVWLKRFDALSAREPQGAEIIKRLCGREAEVVCDPTLLLERSAYEQIMRRPRFGLPGRYIAVYTICGHPWAEKYATLLAKEKGVPVLHLPGGMLARWRFSCGDVKYVSALGPSEWLYFLSHAEAVVTNSFHGTVFSLLFNRPFLIALNGNVADERMLTLLTAVGLRSRAKAEKPRDDQVFGVRVDWGRVRECLGGMSRRGQLFLMRSLGEPEI